MTWAIQRSVVLKLTVELVALLGPPFDCVIELNIPLDAKQVEIDHRGGGFGDEEKE